MNDKGTNKEESAFCKMGGPTTKKGQNRIARKKWAETKQALKERNKLETLHGNEYVLRQDPQSASDFEKERTAKLAASGKVHKKMGQSTLHPILPRDKNRPLTYKPFIKSNVRKDFENWLINQNESYNKATSGMKISELHLFGVLRKRMLEGVPLLSEDEARERYGLLQSFAENEHPIVKSMNAQEANGIRNMPNPSSEEIWGRNKRLLNASLQEGNRLFNGKEFKFTNALAILADVPVNKIIFWLDKLNETHEKTGKTTRVTNKQINQWQSSGLYPLDAELLNCIRACEEYFGYNNQGALAAEHLLGKLTNYVNARSISPGSIRKGGGPARATIMSWINSKKENRKTPTVSRLASFAKSIGLHLELLTTEELMFLKTRQIDDKVS